MDIEEEYNRRNRQMIDRKSREKRQEYILSKQPYRQIALRCGCHLKLVEPWPLRTGGWTKCPYCLVVREVVWIAEEDEYDNTSNDTTDT